MIERTGYGCPRCFNDLVVRQRNADGVEFIGCDSFPKCSRAYSLRRCKCGGVMSLREFSSGQTVFQCRCGRTANYNQSEDGPESSHPLWTFALKEFVPDPPLGHVKRQQLLKTRSTKGKPPMDSDEKTLSGRLADAAKRAPYRVARMRALTEGRKAMLAAIRERVEPSTYEMIKAFLDTDVGQGTVIGIVGLAGPSIPRLGSNRHVSALCEEFLEEGMAKGMNEVVSLMALIIEPALRSALQAIPELPVTAGVRKKRRVASAGGARVVSTAAAAAAAADSTVEEEYLTPPKKANR